MYCWLILILRNNQKKTASLSENLFVENGRKNDVLLLKKRPLNMKSATLTDSRAGLVGR